MKLNLGCGLDIRKDYINIDVRKIPGIDVVHDVSKGLPMYGNNEAEEILAKDVLEHFPRNMTEDLLMEWFRVLRPGGKLLLIFPDLKRIAERYCGINCDNNSQHEIDANMMAYLLYGGQDYEENFHKAGWDDKSIRSELLRIGFSTVVSVSDGGSNLITTAIK